MSKPFTEVVAPFIGRSVMYTNRDQSREKYTIVKLDPREGTLKSGAKGNYVILQRAADGGKTIVVLHPQVIYRMIAKGSDSGIELLPAEEAEQQVSGDATAEEVRAEVVHTEDEPVIPPTDDEVKNNTVAPQPVEKAPSKKDKAHAIFLQLTGEGKARKDVIDAFCKECGMSKAGASTYYQNFKSGAWK